MDSRILNITIVAVENSSITFDVSDASGNTRVHYRQVENLFAFEPHNSLSAVLINNQFQLQKVIRSALKGEPKPGQVVRCVFIRDFPFLSGNDFNHFIQIDRRGDQTEIRVSSDETPGICKLYTDGSYAHETNRSAYAGIIMGRENAVERFDGVFAGGSSGLVELLAVYEGLKRVRGEQSVQVHTDSRFVIRGLAQWINFWRLNDYQMAYGRKVRYASHWQKLDNLGEGRLLELKWIKAHSG
ncbi:MAG: hypothetical protein JXQ80_04255, partial [Bacteroidales bacterium]|nr:hypothetical protein [Bacteroidales bacterium]